MKKKISSLQADLILLLVALLWGTTFVASKIALDYLSPLTIISIRFILAFVLMMLLFRNQIKSIQKEDLKGGIVVGLMLFIAFATQLIALNYTDPGKQAFLAGTYVVFVPFIVWFIYKKKPDSKSFIGAFACFIGISLLTLNKGFSISFGDSLTLLSSMFFAGHIISTSHFVKKSTPVKITIVQFGTVAILSTLTALIFEGVTTGVSSVVVVSVIYLGIICTGVAYFLQTLAQNYTKSTHAAIILSLEAVFGSILSVIIMSELFTVKMIVGCIIIFLSILVIELKGAKKESIERKEELLEKIVK